MNIHHVLNRINEEDYDFFLNMTDEEVKDLSPYVLALWLRGANNNRWAHTLLTDQYLNRNLFTLNRFPRLLYCLACYANGNIDDTRYSFHKDQKEHKSNHLKLVCREYSCNESAASMYIKLLSDDDIKELEEKYKEADQ